MLDAYEAEHFASRPGGRAVSDATLALLAGFYPRPLRALVRRVSLALLDEPLRAGVPLSRPGPLGAGARRRRPAARAVVERRLPARRDPVPVRDVREFAIYPGGYDMSELGDVPDRAFVATRSTDGSATSELPVERRIGMTSCRYAASGAPSGPISIATFPRL